MSLKKKLIALIIFTSLIIIVPVAYFTYISVSASTLAHQEENFENIINFEFSNIVSKYMSLSYSKIEQAEDVKGDLLYETQNIVDLIQALNGTNLSNKDKSAIIKEKIDLSNFADIKSTIFTNQFENYYEKILTETKAIDITGKAVSSYTQYKNLPPHGKYTVFTLSSRAGEETVLAYFAPVNAGGYLDKSVIVAFTSIERLKIKEQEDIQKIIVETGEHFNSLELYPNAFISLVKDKDEALLHRGVDVNLRELNYAFSIASLDQSITLKNHLINDLGYFIQIAYLKPLDWYIIFGVPVEELEKIGQDIVINQVIYSIALTILALIISLVILLKTIKPLEMLTKKVQEFATVNMASEKSLNLFAESLSATTNDEIGLLTKSIKNLSIELSTQVTHLVDVTSSQERLQGELNAARDIQMDILNSPKNAPHEDIFSSAFFLEPAKEVGGDLYEYKKLDDGRYLLVIGDVSGKGVGAALFMSMVVTIIRFAFMVSSDLGKGINNLNNLLASHNDSNMFVTLFAAIFDPRNGEIEYVNGGHCPPLVINQKTNELRMLESLSGPMVGVFEDTDYTVYKDVIHQDERVLVVTDGVTEAMNINLELFSDERLADFIKENSKKIPQELINALYNSILEFRGEAEPSDDITILSFDRQGKN